ncbi:MAG: hypothetical protein K6G60_09550 [Lachnospiraceae bacterium]|nr:hypothetical protein [Lachnospiraceae bacterium]
MKKNYLTSTTLFEEAKRRYDELYGIRSEIKRRLDRCSEGKIHISCKNGNVQYYLRMSGDEKTGTYISKKDVQKIRSYLQKKYDEEMIVSVEEEMKALETLLNLSDHNILSLRKNYSNYPQEIKKHIIPIDISDEEYAAEWLAIPYEGKNVGEDVPMYITDKGEHVRSKSELTIANALAKKGIPYKYECPLKLSRGQIIYPDFTVLNVRTRKELYWEHRGMMDDCEYAKNSVFRIKMMGKDGIYLGDRLIITEETATSSLGTDEIAGVIKHYLL